MNIRILNLSLIGLLFISSNCNAISLISTPKTGNEYLKDCPTSHVIQSWAKKLNSEPLTIEEDVEMLSTFSTCISVIETAYDGVLTHWQLAGYFNLDCYAKYYGLKNFHSDQKNDLLLRYLQDNPEDRHYGLTFNMLKALYKYYPVPHQCYKNSE